jgi:uncharacterized membrane protein YfcA
MRVWKKALIINAGILVGCLAGLYLSPGATPTWLFALACIVVTVAINLAVFLGPRLRKNTGTPAKRRPSRMVEVWIILALSIFALILMRLGYLPFSKP